MGKRKKKTTKPLYFCLKCGAVLKGSELLLHIRNGHCRSNKSAANPSPSYIQTPLTSDDAIGMKVIHGIQKGERWITKLRESCDSFRRRVVYLSVGEGITRAFDVDGKGVILGTHVCHEQSRSESIYAYSGGIVDSNRRKH